VCCPVVGCLIVFLSSLDYGFAFVIIVNTRFYFVIIINTVTMTTYIFCVKNTVVMLVLPGRLVALVLL
jgi:hypothetical protein